MSSVGKEIKATLLIGRKKVPITCTAKLNTKDTALLIGYNNFFELWTLYSHSRCFFKNGKILVVPCSWILCVSLAVYEFYEFCSSPLHMSHNNNGIFQWGCNTCFVSF